MIFDCIYIIGVSAPIAKLLLVLQMFFETPSVRYYCDIIQYMFLFVSVSVNMSLSPLTKFKVLRLWCFVFVFKYFLQVFVFCVLNTVVPRNG